MLSFYYMDEIISNVESAVLKNNYDLIECRELDTYARKYFFKAGIGL